MQGGRADGASGGRPMRGLVTASAERPLFPESGRYVWSFQDGTLTMAKYRPEITDSIQVEIDDRPIK